MKRELPKMYHCSINKEINNIQDVYSSFNKEEYTRIKKYNIINIDNKINEIFNSPNFVYKADVTIELENEIIKRRVVAKRNNNLITIDNELIPISLIKDIY